jgi:hypothetical protein
LRKFAGPEAEGLSANEKLELGLKLSADFYEKNWNRLDFSRSMEKLGRMDRDSFVRDASIIPFSSYFSENTLILHADDDQVVPWRRNSRLLEPIENSGFGIVHLPRGNHCAFPQAISWGVFSQFLTHSLDQSQYLPKRSFPVSAAVRKATALKNAGEWIDRYSRVEWKASAKKNHVSLYLYHLNEAQEGCSGKFNAIGLEGARCQSARAIHIPLTELKFLTLATTGNDSAAANRLERYLNIHTRWKAANGASFLGGRLPPASLEVDGQFDSATGIY